MDHIKLTYNRCSNVLIQKSKKIFFLYFYNGLFKEIYYFILKY
jgi:hypothetical protein